MPWNANLLTCKASSTFLQENLPVFSAFSFSFSWLNTKQINENTVLVRFNRYVSYPNPCTYYSNSMGTFHLLLQGNLVFKLTPSPQEYQIGSIVSSPLNTYRHMSTHRNRNPDNLCNVRCQPYNWTSRTNIFSLCLLNTRSISNKIAELTDFICDRKPDLLAVTEFDGLMG